MPRALWLLYRLRITGWFRRIGRMFQTTRGALLLIISLLMIGGWLTSICVGLVAGTVEPVQASTLGYVDRFAPFALMAYCILVVGTSSSGAMPIVFSPPEVQFLFSGPFSRRQLLTYKLISQLLLALPISVFLTFGINRLCRNLPQALAAALLTFTFMQLFALAVSFVAAVAGELTYSRTRRVLLLLVVVALVLIGGQVMRQKAISGNVVESLEQIEQSTIVQTLVAPFRWYVRLATARHFWPDFAQWAGICVGVNIGLLALIYLMDVSYLESATVASERRYARLQKLRSGGMTGGAMVRPGAVKYSLPMLPWLGGAGPIAWRQLTGATRGLRAMTILLIIISFSAIGPAIATSANDEARTGLPWVLAGMALMMSLMMGQFFAYDFRADVDRMDVLKSLPIHPWRVAVGQLIAPIIIASVFQLAVVIAVYAILGGIGYLVLAVVFLAVPVNLLLMGVENWLFLLFPVRMNVAPGDFSQAGRQILLAFAKMIALAVGVGIPALFGSIVFAITESWIVAAIVAWPIAVAISVIPIPLVAAAYRNFDVTRDTPP